VSIQFEIGRVGKGMGFPMSVLSMMVCCATLLDLSPLVAGTGVHGDLQLLRQPGPFAPFKAFLHLFMHKMRKSEAQLTGRSLQRLNSWNSEQQGARCSARTRGTVLQHHPYATERIATLRFAQRRKIALKYFLRAQIILIISIH
jgi:hypothetical protein